MSTLAVTGGLATALPATASAAVVAENQAQSPQLTPSGIILTGDIDASGLFTGTSYVVSTDPVGPSTKYFIDWGDNSSQSGQIGGPLPRAQSPMPLSHQYTSHGIFTITVMVDEDNGQGMVQQTFTRMWHYATAPTDPTLVVDSTGGVAPFAVNASITGGTVDPAATKEYMIDWGDGSPVETHAIPASGQVKLSHVYAQVGTYRISTLTTDGIDFSPSKEGDADTTVVDAYGVTLSTAAGPNGSVLLQPGGFGAPLATGHSYGFYVTWGDGSPVQTLINGSSQVHPYAKNGTYTISVKMADQADPDNTALPQYIATTTVAVTTAVTPPPTGGPGGPGGPGGSAHLSVGRLWGMDRYQTSDSVANEWAPGSADAVVLARGDAAPDALAGVPFAAHVNGPLLLTQTSAMPFGVRETLDRVTGGPKTKKTVYILGGFSAVSQQQEDTLRTAGYTVVRLGGETRYDTALKVAGQFGPTRHVLVATGLDFPDALAAGPLGAAEKAPVVLTAGSVADPATAAFIRQHAAVDPVGGQAQKAVAALNTTGQTVDHTLAGGDRYATAVAVADRYAAVTGHAPTEVGLASGVAFPDALSGGAFAAKIGMPLLLTAPQTLSSETAGYLNGLRQAKALQSVLIFGGQNAVSAVIQEQLGTM